MYPVVSGTTVVRLLPVEETLYLSFPPVTTVTWYDAQENAEDGLQLVASVLRGRVNAVVRRNKWLAGRLVRRGRGVYLTVPDIEEEELAPFFVEAYGGDAILPGMSHRELKDRLANATDQPDRRQLAIKFGGECVDRDEQIFRVSMVASSRQATRFAVVVSMSHVVGDGHTYFCMLKSILGGESALSVPPTAPAMIPERLADFPETSSAMLGNVESLRGMFYSGFTIAGEVFRNGLNPWRRPFRVRCYEIDSDWIQGEKDAHVPTTEVPYVTTNDVITSWFLRRGEYDYALMTVNMRPYIDGLTPSHAGNYIQTVNYFPEMFATPGGIRLPLNSKLKASRCTEVPGAGERFRLRMASITSWTSFSDEFSSLPGCVKTLHVPFRNPRTGLLQTAGGWMDSALIFRPTPNTAAIMILDRSHDTTDDSMLADPAIKRSVYPLSHSESS